MQAGVAALCSRAVDSHGFVRVSSRDSKSDSRSRSCVPRFDHLLTANFLSAYRCGWFAGSPNDERMDT